MSKLLTPHSPDYWQHEDILELAENSAGIGVWNIDLATGMARGRPQFFRLMGLDPVSGPISMDVIRALRHPDDRERVVEGFQRALASGNDTYEIEYRIIRPDGQVRWIFGRGRVVRDRKGEPTQYSGVDIDVTERKAVEAALAASEDRYRMLVDQASDIVAMLDLDFTFTAVNPAVERILGYTPDEIVGTSLSSYVPPAQLAKHSDMLGRKLHGAGSTQYEMQLLGKDRRTFTLEVNSRLVFDAANKPIAVHAIARDISERKNAEARQAVLIRELQHRTRNMLAVIQSVASNTIRRSEDLTSAHEALVGRLRALAQAQEFVATGESAGILLRELVDAELAPFAPRASIEGAPVVLGGSFAQMFALIVHELATNATKHGSLSSPGGSVSITWKIDCSSAEPLLVFSWTERSGPPVSLASNRKGFGSQLIAMVGDPKLSFNREGFEYLLEIPLAEATSGSVGA